MNSFDETEKLLLIFISLKPFTAGLSLSVSKKVHSVSVINLIWAIPLWEIAKCVIYSREWFSTNIQNSRVINISIGLVLSTFISKMIYFGQGTGSQGHVATKGNYQYHFSQLCGSWFKTTLFFPFHLFSFLSCSASHPEYTFWDFFGIRSKIYWRCTNVEYVNLSRQSSQLKVLNEHSFL